MSDRSRRYDIALVVVRVVLGLVFVMHGWQKYDTYTIDGVESMFDGMGVPFAYPSAVAVTMLELAGGVALVIGVLTRPIAVLFALNMAGALYFAHWDAGFYATNGGYELVLVLGVLSAMFATVGAGRYSVDRWLENGRTRVSSMAG
ncbi:DoxX family protein [Solicola gregarius]|uniref:DoxX family protein n=1 Tax=Solicola gregarius TaxID=2908642 RepID=A0AA46TFG7_9ACTN|nr:DoxX family protein [Solicola gregarius]UYM03842.1 DoxX family protein [Solicola gregarius]